MYLYHSIITILNNQQIMSTYKLNVSLLIYLNFLSDNNNCYKYILYYKSDVNNKIIHLRWIKIMPWLINCSPENDNKLNFVQTQ